MSENQKQQTENYRFITNQLLSILNNLETNKINDKEFDEKMDKFMNNYGDQYGILLSTATVICRSSGNEFNNLNRSEKNEALLSAATLIDNQS